MIQLEPSDVFQKLEFDKILELVEEECFGMLGKLAVAEIYPDTDRASILRKLKQVEEYQQTLGNDPFPLTAYEDLAKDLKMLEIELIKEIDRVIDEEGKIKEDASPRLLKIKRSMGAKAKELEKQFRFIITKYRNLGWLSDTVESFRNNRRVLSVPAEHKRKIRGIIHDESTTGRTAFIEPEEIIEINNDIFELQVEERREIYNILKELSAVLRPYVPAIGQYQDLLVELDVIQAKARLITKKSRAK